MKSNYKLFLIILYIISLSFLANSLILEELDVEPELYEQSVRKILERRVFIYMRFKDFQKAEENLLKLKEFFPDMSEYLDYRLKEVRRLKENKKSAKRNKNPKIYSDKRLDKLIEMAEGEKNAIRAIQLYKAVLVHRKDPEATRGIGKRYYDLKKYFEARKWFKKNMDDYSRNMIEKIDMIEKRSVKIMKISVEEKSSSKKDNHDIIKEAEKLLESDRLKEALELLEKNTRLDPTNHHYVYMLAKIYMDNSMYNKALENLEKTILLNKDNYEAYYLKGEIYSKTGRFDEAINIFRKLIKISPEDSKYYRMSRNMIKLLTNSY